MWRVILVMFVIDSLLIIYMFYHKPYNHDRNWMHVLNEFDDSLIYAPLDVTVSQKFHHKVYKSGFSWDWCFINNILIKTWLCPKGFITKFTNSFFSWDWCFINICLYRHDCVTKVSPQRLQVRVSLWWSNTCKSWLFFIYKFYHKVYNLVSLMMRYACACATPSLRNLDL